MMSAFDAAELDLIRSSLRHVLDTNAPAEVPGALLAEGWSDLVATDAAAAFTILAEEAGRARSSAPVADLAMLHGAGLNDVATTAVIVDGYVLAGSDRAEHFVCITDDGIAQTLAAIVELISAGGFDPALGLSHATVTGTDRDAAGDAAAAASAIAACVSDDELHPGYVVPSVFDRSVAPAVASAVADAAVADGVIRP